MSQKLNSNIYYDINAIMNFVFADDDGRSSDVEITESQVRNEETGNLETESRIIREVKSADGQKQTLKYDMVKMFIETLDNVEIDTELAPLSLGQQLILNTLGVYGLVKEIEK